MKISTDKLTTYAGLATGLLTLVGQSGVLNPQLSQILIAGSGLGVAVLGYFTNKSRV